MPFKRVANCSHLVTTRGPVNHLSSRLARKPTQRWLSSINTVSSTPKVVFSGIQPTGIPHLGNYLGALRQWAKLQETEPPETRLLYSIVDLHAITVKQDPKHLKQWRKESLATLLAIGLDPSRCTIFYQSDVPAHSELMWILSCTASVGYLSRMTQWKSKLALPDNAKPMDVPLQLGLFSYPVLQAADVLVHQVTHVPVGEDQSQHLEFARACASSFNHQYGNVLIEPETILSSAKRVMSLTNPTKKKMSKSDTNDKSRILLTDSRELIRRKIKAAVTDSEEGVTYDPDKRPEIANLVNLLLHLADDESVSPQDMIQDVGHSKAALKDKLTDAIDAHLEPIRERYNELISPEESDYLMDLAEEGAEIARLSADATVRKVRDAIGFGNV